MPAIKKMLAVTECLCEHAFLLLFALVVALLIGRPCVAQGESKPGEPVRRPNLIWIMADDLGYGELGCYGQELIETPNLDRMASEGLQFRHFYSGATVCAPSRSVLMTGLHHGHTRVRGNAGANNPKAQSLRASDVTVAKVLQESGYETALIGKWGLGDAQVAEEGLPRRQGFDYFYGFLNQVHAHNHYPDFLWENEERILLPNENVAVGNAGGGYAVRGEAYADELFAKRAIEFATEKRDRPFFLYWSMVIPHANNERTRELKDGTEVPTLGRYADERWPESDKGHAAMVTVMDSYVGRMLEALKKHGIERETLVIFTSDNGPHNESNHHPSRFNPSGQFSGLKRSLTDGGIRVPCIAWWPGVISPGSKTDHVAYFGDWFATACELSGARLPAGLDSISFASLLGTAAVEQREQHEYLYWEFHEGGFKQAALYKGRWKGILRKGKGGPLELFDLQTDPSEGTDVSSSQHEIAVRMLDFLSRARTNSEDWPAKW